MRGECSLWPPQSTQIKQLTANIILLDNFLEQYGSETGAVRNLLRRGRHFSRTHVA
jgi:hypothetical protein